MTRLKGRKEPRKPEYLEDETVARLNTTSVVFGDACCALQGG
jgi:hypothetical protein